MFSSAKILIQADSNAALLVNLVKNTKKFIEDLKQYFGKNEC